MASGFHGHGDVCEGKGCQKETGVTYYVKEKQRLCEDCACLKGCDETIGQVGADLICPKHDKILEFYCKSHDLAGCQTCIMLEHRTTCELAHVKDTIAARRNKLKDLAKQAKESISAWKRHAEDIKQQIQFAKVHLKSVCVDVKTVVNDTLNIDSERVCRERERINRIADDEIEKINERREGQLKELEETATQRREKKEGEQTELLKAVHEDIQGSSREKYDDLLLETENTLQEIEHTQSRIEALLLNIKTIIEKTEDVIVSLGDDLKKEVKKEALALVTNTVESVRFVRGQGDDRHKGRIVCAYGTEWQLEESIPISMNVKYPFIVGCLSENEIVVSNCAFPRGDVSVFLMNTNSKETKKMFDYGNEVSLISCALLDDDTIACGKRSVSLDPDTLSGCITLYNRQWKDVKDVVIPRNAPSGLTAVYVAAHDGKILACEHDQTRIYVINPANGKVENAITTSGDKIRMCGVMPSGDIIARRALRDDTLLIIDKHGWEKEIPCGEQISNATVDPLTGTLFVSCYDEEREMCVVYKTSCDGPGQLAFSFPMESHCARENQWMHIGQSQTIITPAGKAIVCDGKNILIYKQTSCFTINP